MKRPRLQTLIFEVTQRCNHACRHCYNVWNPAAPDIYPAAPDIYPAAMDPGPAYPRGELDTPHTLALLGKALDETICRHVTLTGGEPLLRPDLPQIVDLLRWRGITTTLISNGRLLVEPAVVDLLDRGVSLFELPLLSHRREVHDRLSGAPGAFDAVVSAMANVRYHGGQFVAVFVATRPNLPDLREVIKLAFALGAQGLMLKGGIR